jgi:hypothetical protein
MASATLTWYPSSDPTVLGYHIRAGQTSHVYDAPRSPKDVGNVTTGTFELNANGVWYFVITAYKAFGDGGPSPEVTGVLLELGAGAATVSETVPGVVQATSLRPRSTVRFS